MYHQRVSPIPLPGRARPLAGLVALVAMAGAAHAAGAPAPVPSLVGRVVALPRGWVEVRADEVLLRHGTDRAGPIPVPGTVLDAAWDGRRIWVLYAAAEDVLRAYLPDGGATRRRIPLGRRFSRHLAAADGLVWVGTDPPLGRGFTVLARHADGAQGPEWSVSPPPPDEVEQQVWGSFAGEPPAEYELVAVGRRAVAVLETRNLLLVFDPAGGEPRVVRWPSLVRELQELGVSEVSRRRRKLRALAGPGPHVRAAAALGEDAVLVVETTSEAEVAACRALARGGPEPSGPFPGGTLTVVSLHGEVLAREALPFRARTIDVAGSEVLACCREGRIVRLPLPREAARSDGTP